MQRHLRRRLQHHEGAAAVADLAAGRVDHHAAAAGAAIAIANETMAARSRPDDAGARRRPKLQRHADGGKARRRMQIGAHRGAEREIREDGERADVAAAVRFGAVRTGLVRHARVAARHLIEGQLDEVAGKMQARRAVEADRAQHAPAYLIVRAHLLSQAY